MTFQWTPAKERRALKLRDEGRSHFRIAEIVGARSPDTIRKFLQREEEKKLTPNVLKAGTRTCLKCQKPFDSEGPHNRVCNPCKNTASWSAGMDYQTPEEAVL